MPSNGFGLSTKGPCHDADQTKTNIFQVDMEDKLSLVSHPCIIGNMEERDSNLFTITLLFERPPVLKDKNFPAKR